MTQHIWPQVPTYYARRTPWQCDPLSRVRDEQGVVWEGPDLEAIVDLEATEWLANGDAVQFADAAAEIFDVIRPLLMRGDVLRIGQALHAAVMAQCRRLAARDLELDDLDRYDEVKAAQEAIK